MAVKESGGGSGGEVDIEEQLVDFMKLNELDNDEKISSALVKHDSILRKRLAYADMRHLLSGMEEKHPKSASTRSRAKKKLSTYKDMLGQYEAERDKWLNKSRLLTIVLNHTTPGNSHAGSGAGGGGGGSGLTGD